MGVPHLQGDASIPPEDNILRVLQGIQTTGSPGIVPTVPGSLARSELHVPRGRAVNNR
jgi:hypothetical protein